MDIGTIIEGIEIADVLITTVTGSAAVSEVLPHMRKVKANSTFQLIWNIVKMVAGSLKKKEKTVNLS